MNGTRDEAREREWKAYWNKPGEAGRTVQPKEIFDVGYAAGERAGLERAARIVETYGVGFFVSEAVPTAIAEAIRALTVEGEQK